MAMVGEVEQERFPVAMSRGHKITGKQHVQEKANRKNHEEKVSGKRVPLRLGDRWAMSKPLSLSLSLPCARSFSHFCPSSSSYDAGDAV